MRISVIPAKAGIQGIHTVTISLDPGFRRGDDFLRDRHLYVPQRLYEVAVAAGAKDFAGLVDRLGGVQGENWLGRRWRQSA